MDVNQLPQWAYSYEEILNELPDGWVLDEDTRGNVYLKKSSGTEGFRINTWFFGNSVLETLSGDSDMDIIDDPLVPGYIEDGVELFDAEIMVFSIVSTESDGPGESRVTSVSTSHDYLEDAGFCYQDGAYFLVKERLTTDQFIDAIIHALSNAQIDKSV